MMTTPTMVHLSHCCMPLLPVPRGDVGVVAATLMPPHLALLCLNSSPRSHVWELIARSKAGRCVVLTTHSMEEAEVLGDRVAVLAAGGGRERVGGCGLRARSHVLRLW